MIHPLVDLTWGFIGTFMAGPVVLQVHILLQHFLQRVFDK